MSALTERDLDRLLLELGKVQKARAEELAQEGKSDRLEQGVFAPLSEAETRALVEGVVRRIHPAGRQPARWTRRALGLAAVAAAALGLVLWSGPRALPEFTLSSPRADSLVRSEAQTDAEGSTDGAPRHYTIGRQLRFVLRASRADDSRVHTYLFSERRSLLPIHAFEARRTDGGSVIVTLETGPRGYAPAPGDDTLVFVLAGGEAPTEREIRHDAHGAELRVLRLRVVWQAGAENASEHR